MNAPATLFYVLINIYVFSAYFTKVVAPDPVRGQVLWGYTLSIAAVIVALLAPFLGAFADAGGRRKPWLFVCVVFAAPAIASLWFAAPGLQSGVYWVMLALIVANVCYELSSIFYNALLPNVAAPRRFGLVSGLAYALANLSGIVLFGAYLIGASLLVVSIRLLRRLTSQSEVSLWSWQLGWPFLRFHFCWLCRTRRQWDGLREL